jgi:DNA-binding FadR family transcriptional regulator
LVAGPTYTDLGLGVGVPLGDGGQVSAGPEKLAAQVARQLEDEIIDRKWPVGEGLGSETELQDRFGVSRSVLREAVRLLEHHEVARMHRGRGGGLVVCAPDASPATRALVIYLEYVGTSVEDLLRARLLLEPLAARLAAETVTEDGIDGLRAILAQEKTQIDEPGWSANDEFHVALGRLSGNAVLRLFIEVLTRLTVSYARTSRRMSREALAKAKAGSAARHAEITDAVISGDAAAAQIRLTSHLDEVEAWLLANRTRPTEHMRTRPADPDPDDRRRRKLAEVIAGRIHDDIINDGRQVGEVLGLESELLTRYGVSRAVLREAIRILEHHSVARMRRGPNGGLVILAPDPTASIHTMALYLDYQGLSPDDLRVVREAIELGCIQAVATAAPAPNAASRLHAAGQDDSGDVFHTELAELAGNPVLTLFLRIITELWARHSRTERPPTPAVETEVRRVHDRILDAVLAGDEGLAQHRMRRHLQALTTWWH